MMEHFEDVMNQLRQDNEVPKKVMTKLDETLNSLPDYEGEPYRRKWRKGVAAAAAFAVIGSVVCYTNPALAARIPLIGNIFGKIQQEVPFSGKYSEKAQVLTEEGTDGSNKYVAIDADTMVTISEIYCDGLSVFLTMQVEVEQGGLENIPGHSVINRDGTVDMMYLEGEWALSGGSKSKLQMHNNLEGKVLDDHIFVGMAKIDLNGIDLDQGALQLDLSGIGWDDTTMDNPEDISQSVKVSGQWNFEIPFRTDKESARGIALGQQKNGYTLQKVFVSPYQVVVTVDAPVISLKKDIQRSDYEEKFSLAEGEEDPDMSYEEYVALQNHETVKPSETVVCNQDGELLSMGDMSTTSGTTTFAVGGKDISSLHIYVFANGDDYEVVGKRIDMDTAGENAVISAKVSMK